MNFNNHGVIVPDTSFWQDDDSTVQKIDFAKMKAAGAEGVILRGGQNTWADEDFLDYKRAAKEAGLARGYYWFFDSRSDPGKQANLWRALIVDDLPELGLWYDFEESYHGSFAGEKYWRQFALAMDAFYPSVAHGIYTARWWWDAQTVTEPVFWSRYPLWVAQYGVTQADVVLPKPWLTKEPVFWQFTAHGDGQKYGVESLNIDLNYFNGDVNTFRTYFRLGDEVPTQPEPGETMATYKGTVTATATLQIREGPGTSYDDIGDLHYLDKVEASDILGGWWELVRVNGQAATGYSFSNNGAWIRTDAVLGDQPTDDPIVSGVLTVTRQSGATEKYNATFAKVG